MKECKNKRKERERERERGGGGGERKKERERDREREGDGERERGGEREKVSRYDLYTEMNSCHYQCTTIVILHTHTYMYTCTPKSFY